MGMLAVHKRTLGMSVTYMQGIYLANIGFVSIRGRFRAELAGPGRKPRGSMLPASLGGPSAIHTFVNA